MATDVREVSVLIAGGAGAGLASSIFLGRLGIDHWLVERHPDTSPAPKAHYINPRTMELFREVGLADRVYEAAAPLENMQSVGWYTTLGGDGPLDRKQIALMEAFGGGSLEARYSAHTPCRATNYPQLRLEPMMRDHAQMSPHAHLNYYHELVDFDQDADGVTATIRDRATDEEYRVRARYMIAADGGKMIGPKLGVEMDGLPRLIDMFSAHFEADLSPWIDDDRPMIRWFNNPDQVGGTWGSGVIVAMGPDHYDRRSREWLVHFAFQPDDPQQFDTDTIVPRLQALLKLPDLDMRVIKTNNWQVQGVLARQFRHDRIFLAGDAAHRHPPTNGLGLNSAIQDAHNLAWKLAMVLDDQAGDGLLDSYEAERRAVTGLNVEWSLTSFQNHLTIDSAIGLIPGAPPEINRRAYELLFSDTPLGAMRRQKLDEVVRTQRIEFQAERMDMGFHYEQGALVPDGSTAPAVSVMGDELVPTGRPGHRLPHMWVETGGEKRSTLDLLDYGRFTLFTASDGSAWSDAASSLSDKASVNAVQIGGTNDAQPVDGDFAELCGIGPDGAILVRPDGHVAWRSVGSVDEPAATLNAVLKEILA